MLAIDFPVKRLFSLLSEFLSVSVVPSCFHEQAPSKLGLRSTHSVLVNAGGLWLPKQFLVTPRAHEMIGLFEKQQELRSTRQKRQQRSQKDQGRRRQSAPPPSDHALGSTAAATPLLPCVDDRNGFLKVGTCAANKLHPGCDIDLHTLHGGVLYGPEFAGVTVADLCPKTCGRCSG